MIKLSVYNQGGDRVSELELNPKIFGVKASGALVHQVITAILANRRSAVAHTKTRGDVRGGGKKPWKQKGTGRARHGSTRSPIWRGGGITFGPRSDRNFSQKINKSMKRQALLGVLSDKVAENKVIILEDLKLSAPKTKEMAGILKILKDRVSVDFGRKILLAIPTIKEDLMRASKNLSKLWLTNVGSLNVYDVLNNNLLVTTVGGIKKMEEIFGGK
jgi:large subunit ribosomal protein L4